MSERDARGLDEAAISAAWKDALDTWDVSVTLSPPQSFAGKRGSRWKGDEPLAYIDLETREVVVNLELLEKLGAASSLTAVLAHEIGHHVRFPHSLALAASCSSWRSGSSRVCASRSRTSSSTSSSTSTSAARARTTCAASTRRS